MVFTLLPLVITFSKMLPHLKLIIELVPAFLQKQTAAHLQDF